MVDLYRFNPFRQGVDMYSGGLESDGWELLSNHENCSSAYAHRQRFVGETAASSRPGSAGRSPLHPAYGGYSPRRKSDLAEPWMRRSPSDRQLDQLASSDGQRRGRSQSPRPHSPRGDRKQRRQQQLQRPATLNHDVGDEQQHSPLRQHGAQEAAAAPTFRKSANVKELNLLQSFGQAVICTDLQGIITFWNRAAETLYGWRGEEVVGVSVLNVLIPSRLIKEAADIINRVGQGDSWTGRYPCLRRDGVVLDTVVTKSPIVDDNGTIVGVIGSSIDAKSISTDKSSLSRAYADEWPKSDLDARCCEEYDQHGRWSPRAADAHSRFPTDAAQTTDDSSKGSSKSLLQRLGCTSVQQILRKFNFRGYKSSDDSCAQSQQSKGKEQRAYSSESGSSQSRFSSAYRDDCSLDMREHMLSVSGQRPWTHTASESCNNHAIASAASNHSLGYPLGTDVNVLSRTSSGSTGGSPMAASVAGSPNGSVPNSGALSAAAGGSVNFQQAEEDFQLQLALALRVAAEAAAIDDPDLVANLRGPIGGTRMMPGVSKIESIAYRYWVSNCLSYDDHIEDGFFEIWGMSPYVWSMCTDSNELGRMPPLESLRSVHPADAVFEVVLVDRSLDPELCGLEDKAVGLAYDCTEVLDLARKLGKLVATVMGGAAASDEVLLQAWKSCSAQVMQVVSSIVIPIGKLKTGLCRHRALLFKVLADSVGLSCRLVRGSSYCGKEDDAMVVVKCGDDKEWMIDLLANPGHIMPPDARLSAPPAVIASPLQFDRASPFAGSSISVMDWARPELGSSAVPSSSAAGEQVQASVPAVSNIAFRTTVIEPNGTMSELPVEKEGKWQIPLARGLPDEKQVGPVGNAGSNHDDRFCKNSVEQKLKVGQRAADGVNGPGTPKGHSGQELEANPVKAGRADDGSPRLDTSRWALEDMRHYIESGGASNTLKSSVVKRMLVNAEDLEIPWEDMSIGERIGQGSYGKVYRGDWQGSDVAVKVFLDQDLKLEALEEFRSEVAIMRRLRHPNIVLFMGAVMRPPNLSIVTEFCPRGSLFRLLHRPNRELDERRRIRMALDVVKGMNYLHRCSPPVVHRDLKSPNLLVDKNWTVKVCDFGLSRQKSSTFLSSKSSAGTPEWMAPEVLRNEPSDEKSDIYSFGVILWELATLQVPWAGLSPIQVVGAVGFQHRRLPIPDTVDPTIAAIIQACWRMDPKTRPSFADIMQELKPLQRTQQNSPTQKRPTSPDATELERA